MTDLDVEQPASAKQFREGIAALERESAGVLKVELFRTYDDMHSLVRFAQAVGRNERPMCLLCDHAWESAAQPPPTMFVNVKAATFPAHVLIAGICQKCARRPKTLLRRVLAVLKKVWPDLRGVHEPPRGLPLLRLHGHLSPRLMQ